MTKVEAIKAVLENNGGIATWEIIYNEIEQFYPLIKKQKDWTAGVRGVLYREIKNNKNFKKIDDSTFSLIDYDNINLVLEKEDIITTKDILSAIRIGQNKFREKLLKKIKHCPITGINDNRILVASHIKPWSQSKNIERLDVNNGFIFTPTFDKLFDRGLISFLDNKEIIISSSMSHQNVNILGIYNGKIIDDLPVIGREDYLKYHREKIFRK